MASSTMNVENQTLLEDLENFINEEFPVQLDENNWIDEDLNSQNFLTALGFDLRLYPELLPDTELDSRLNAMNPSDNVASLPSPNPICPTQNISNLSEPDYGMPMLGEAWMNTPDPLPPNINDRIKQSPVTSRKRQRSNSPVTSRKRQRSNILYGEAEFGNSKLRGLAINKGLDSAGATTSPSDENSNSSPRSTDRDDFVSAPTSSRVYAGKHIPATYSSQRKRKLTPDVSEKLPQSKRRRRQVETTQIPADHPYSTNTITAKHPKSKTNARTTEKKMKVRLRTNNAPKEPACTDQKQKLDPGPLIKNGEKVILRPGYSHVEQRGETKGRRCVFNKPPIQVKYNKAANNLRREQIVRTTKRLLSTNKIIQRRMARFSFLPGVTVKDVDNAWNNWVTIENDQENYLKDIRCWKATASAKNDSCNKAQLEHILANNGVMRADEPNLSDRLKKIDESKIIHEVKQRFSASQGFILFFIEKFKITSPLLSGYVLRNVHPENVSDKVKEIILQGEIARPSPPVKRECKEKNKEVEDTPKYRQGEEKRMKHNAMERKRRLEQKMCFEVVRLTCPDRYNQKKSAIHDILRGLKNTLSMTSTYFYKKIVLKLEQKGYGNQELTKLKRLCELTNTEVRRESHS